MNKQYGIATPTGFKPVIDDILNLYKDSHRETLVVSLQGDLGAGKTAFTQELARSLGVVEVVTSPTFTIMKQYEIDNKDFDLMVHIDAYRIESEEEVEPLHLESVFTEPKQLFV